MAKLAPGSLEAVANDFAAFFSVLGSASLLLTLAICDGRERRV
jgi:hypothetical protein